MNNIVKAGLLASVAILATGCMEQPKPQQIIEKKIITKEVLVPHNTDVKKAVAILIYKLREIEKQSGSNAGATEQKLIDLQNQINKQDGSITANR